MLSSSSKYSYCSAVEQELECSICRSTYNNPAILPCKHTYCYDCIRTALRKGINNCPQCHVHFQPRDIGRYQKLQDLIDALQRLGLLRPRSDLDGIQADSNSTRPQANRTSTARTKRKRATQRDVIVLDDHADGPENEHSSRAKRAKREIKSDDGEREIALQQQRIQKIKDDISYIDMLISKIRENLEHEPEVPPPSPPPPPPLEVSLEREPTRVISLVNESPPRHFSIDSAECVMGGDSVTLSGPPTPESGNKTPDARASLCTPESRSNNKQDRDSGFDMFSHDLPIAISNESPPIIQNTQVPVQNQAILELDSLDDDFLYINGKRPAVQPASTLPLTANSNRTPKVSKGTSNARSQNSNDAKRSSKIRTPSLLRPRSVNVSSHPHKTPTLCASMLSSVELAELKRAVEALGGKLVESFNESVTHLVTKTSKKRAQRSLKFMLAILNHCWIVDVSWVQQSLKCKEWKDERRYLVKGDTSGNSGGPELAISTPRSSRLLDHLSFYLHGQFRKPPREEVEQLILSAGAVLLDSLPEGSPPDSVVILYDVAKDVAELRKRASNVVNVSWLLDSISRYTPQDYENYR